MSRPGPLRALLSLLFCSSGVLHFTHTRRYERIMPPYLPAHRELVLVSGGVEIAGGAGVLIGALRRLIRPGLVALLVAVFPANVQMALDPEGTGAGGLPRWLLWVRLPLQALLVAGVVRATAEPDG